MLIDEFSMSPVYCYLTNGLISFKYPQVNTKMFCNYEYHCQNIVTHYNSNQLI